MGAEHSRKEVCVVEQYLAALERRRFSPKTVATYQYPLRALLTFLRGRGVEDLKDVAPADLDAWRKSLIKRDLTDASLEVFLRAARNLFRWMESEDLVFVSPASGLKTPRYRRKLLPVPTENELARVLAQQDTTTPLGLRDRAILEVGYSCALRREELAGLTLKDIDLLTQTVTVFGKGSCERALPLASQALGWLRRYVEEARPALIASSGTNDETPAIEALWIRQDGMPLKGTGITFMLKRFGRMAGLSIPLTPHALRRACATHMLRAGAPPVQIQMLLGHSTMAHLSQYLRLTITDIRKMHAESRLGK